MKKKYCVIRKKEIKFKILKTPILMLIDLLNVYLQLKLKR